MTRRIGGMRVGQFMPEQVLRDYGIDTRTDVKTLVETAKKYDKTNKGYLSGKELGKAADELRANLRDAPTTTGDPEYSRRVLRDTKDEYLSGNPNFRYTDKQLTDAASKWGDGNNYLNRKELEAGAIELQMSQDGKFSAADMAAVRSWTGLERLEPVEGEQNPRRSVIDDEAMANAADKLNRSWASKSSNGGAVHVATGVLDVLADRPGAPGVASHPSVHIPGPDSARMQRKIKRAVEEALTDHLKDAGIGQQSGELQPSNLMSMHVAAFDLTSRSIAELGLGQDSEAAEKRAYKQIEKVTTHMTAPWSGYWDHMRYLGVAADLKTADGETSKAMAHFFISVETGDYAAFVVRHGDA